MPAGMTRHGVARQRPRQRHVIRPVGQEFWIRVARKEWCPRPRTSRDLQLAGQVGSREATSRAGH